MYIDERVLISNVVKAADTLYDRLTYRGVCPAINTATTDPIPHTMHVAFTSIDTRPPDAYTLSIDDALPVFKRSAPHAHHHTMSFRFPSFKRSAHHAHHHTIFFLFPSLKRSALLAYHHTIPFRRPVFNRSAISQDNPSDP